VTDESAEATQPTNTDADPFADVDAGAFIGHEPDLSREDIPVEGDLIGTPIPDPGWRKPPEGHRQFTHVSDDDLKRKG
jgi:hypothetical protein